MQKLEELQKEKLKELTLKVRQEIDSYWEKCFYSDEQRAAFHPFYNGNVLWLSNANLSILCGEWPTLVYGSDPVTEGNYTFLSCL